MNYTKILPRASPTSKKHMLELFADRGVRVEPDVQLGTTGHYECVRAA